MIDENGHMSGPEHYRKAERILAGETAPAGDLTRIVVFDLDAIAAAQVHATLAVAAAKALETVSQFMGLVNPDSMGDDQVITEWAKATGWRTIVGASRFPSEDGPF